MSGSRQSQFHSNILLGYTRRLGDTALLLSRLSKTFDCEQVHTYAYLCVLGHFNFCPTVWHFCKSYDTLKIGKVQYRALNYAFNDRNCSYDILRRHDNVPLFHIRRWKTDLLVVYKAYLSYDCQYRSDMFKKQSYDYHTRNSKALVQHQFYFVWVTQF